eukprot:scaffold216645_cov32-Prasinocladus_malaysianus.AAC.1
MSAFSKLNAIMSQFISKCPVRHRYGLKCHTRRQAGSCMRQRGKRQPGTALSNSNVFVVIGSTRHWRLIKHSNGTHTRSWANLGDMAFAKGARGLPTP